MATNLLKNIVEVFPQKYLRLAFAYGSGVFQQQNHKHKSQNMIDFIFVVDEPMLWHEENLAIHSNHYSFLKYLGAGKVAAIQERLGAFIYFNTLVPFHDRTIKYGVISQRDFINDLMDWETLYVSGRLHKPVDVVHRRMNGQLQTAMQANLQSAVHTALLTLSDSFTEEDFYIAVTGLSYSGDFRMQVAEDPNKVSNIVLPNIERFRELYEPILDNEEHLFWDKTSGRMEQSLSHVSRFHHLNLLPKCVLQNVISHLNRDGHHRDFEEVVDKVAHRSDCSDVVRDSVRNIVLKSSLTQSLKGLATAGFRKSFWYSLEKVKKKLKTKQKKN